jgi:putative ABC transport system permease protein
VSLDSKTLRASNAEADALFAEIRGRVARVPGVSDAAIAESIELDSYVGTSIAVPGFTADSPPIKRGANLRSVTSTYFATIGTRLVDGHAFGEAEDRAAGEPVAIIGAGLAKALWPTETAVGHCVRLGYDSLPCRRIVGVAEDTHGSATSDRESDFPYVYVPLSQGRHLIRNRVVIARAPDPEHVVGNIRSAVQSVDANLPFADVWLLQSRLDPEVRPWKLGATMFGVFGGLALVLAALGLYSVIAYSVSQRVHELGIRIAIGARRRDILTLIEGQGATLAGIGIAVALMGATVLAPLIQPLLFQTSARSPAVYGVVAGVMFGVALAACLIPAARASRVNPMLAIRSD